MEILLKSESCSLGEAVLKLKKLLNSPLSTRLQIKVSKHDALLWLKGQTQFPKIYYSNREGTLEIAAVGAAHAVSCTRAKDISSKFYTISETLKATKDPVKYFGGMCFDPQNLNEEWKDFGTFWFVLPRFELIQDRKESFLVCNLGTASPETIAQELDHLKFEPAPDFTNALLYDLRTDHPGKEEWLMKSAQLLKAIGTKQLSKVVLAKETQFSFNTPIDPWDLLAQLKSDKSDCYHYCFNPKSNIAFLGASPERLYEREGRHIKTEAIAGTRPRGTSSQEEERFKNDLLNSPKELSEHKIVVDFIEEKLSSVCSELKWNKRAALLRLKEGQHLHSTAKGLLKPNVTDEELIFKLHPTPAVNGVPQEKAMQAIREAEPFSRGWYAGPVGWMAQDSAEFAVAIRSGLLQGSKLSLFSGAGLVEGSAPESEWEEVEQKLAAFLKILKK